MSLVSDFDHAPVRKQCHLLMQRGADKAPPDPHRGNYSVRTLRHCEQVVGQAGRCACDAIIETEKASRGIKVRCTAAPAK